MESEDLSHVMDYLKKMTEPNTALIITQNEQGEIIDVRVMDVNEALFILRNANGGEAPEEKLSEDESASDGSWWSPAT